MKEEYEKLYHEFEQDHFWFKARRKYILAILKNVPADAFILDIGCSSGILLNDLKEKGFDRNNLYGVDISETAIDRCRERGISNAKVMDAHHVLLDKKFDVIIASDCLEHIEHDSNALENWHGLLKENGMMLVFVPAYMALWSEHDEENKHFRRYRRGELKEKLESSGFEILKSSYWNFFLFFPLLLIRTLRKWNVFSGQNAAGDFRKTTPFNTLLFLLMDFENRLLDYVDFPVGISAFCISRKISRNPSGKEK